MQLKVSHGNSKMGSIPSVSLPAGVTCRSDCECCRKCYAKKLERFRPSVHAAYQSNLALLKSDPDTYWREAEAAVMTSRFFRFHVSGDIPNESYFLRMVRIAQRNPHCEILCFTKKYDIVNRYLRSSALVSSQPVGSDAIIAPQATPALPPNLHIIFSAWRNLEMENPFGLPEAHVRYRDGSTTANADAKACGGNCTECAVTDCGCWTLQPGQQVVFNEH